MNASNGVAVRVFGERLGDGVLVLLHQLRQLQQLLLAPLDVAGAPAGESLAQPSHSVGYATGLGGFGCGSGEAWFSGLADSCAFGATDSVVIIVLPERMYPRHDAAAHR